MMGNEIAPPATASNALSSRSRKVTFLIVSFVDFFMVNLSSQACEMLLLGSKRVKLDLCHLF